MSTDTEIIIALLAVGWVALSTTCHWFRARFLLKQWATANGFELVKISIPWSKVSPFLFTSKHQEVYQIRVRNHHGRERHGWA